MNAINITAFTQDNSQIEAIKTFMKTLKIKFEIEEKPYNPEFVVKIRQSEKEINKEKQSPLRKKISNNF